MEEDLLLASGTGPAHNLSESQMLVEALAIEEQQYVAMATSCERNLLTTALL